MVALVGVHGVGKTTTARALGYPVRYVEAYHMVAGLPPRHRQLVFFLEFAWALLEAAGSREQVLVLDNHPLLVLPYTDYFVGDNGLTRAMESMLLQLPRVNLLVLLDPADTETVLERIVMRGRNVEEEAVREYVEYITARTREYFNRLGRRIAEDVFIVPAERDVEERVRIIRDRILGSLRGAH